MNIGAGDRNRTGDVQLGKLLVPRCAVMPCEKNRGEGCTNLDSRYGLVVFVKQTAQEVAPIHVGGHSRGSGRPLMRSHRWGQPKPSVWSLVVVMADVDLEHPFEVGPIPDEEPLETLRPHRPDPALRVS